MMNGGIIGSCRADDDGGAVFIKQGGFFVMNGGTIENCTAGANGGAVNIYENGSFTMTGGIIKDCKVDLGGLGNAIYVNGQKVSAPFVGGAMYIPSIKTITMPTVTVIDVVEIKGLTVSFKDGDKPVFTGKVPDGANYAYRCEWWELGSKTGAMSTAFGNFYENKFTAFEAGKTYHYGVYVTTYGDVENVSYIFGRDTKLKINGEFVNYKRYEGDTSNGSNGTMWVITDLAITPQDTGATPDYKIVEGANGIWTKNTDGTLKFVASGDFAKFTGLRATAMQSPQSSTPLLLAPRSSR